METTSESNGPRVHLEESAEDGSGTKKNEPENRHAKSKPAFAAEAKNSASNNAEDKVPKPNQVKPIKKVKIGPSTLLDDVYEALLRMDDTPGSFCTGRVLKDCYLPHDKALTIEGIGPIPLPITDTYVSKLKEIAEQAPHGRGTETIVDMSVRNTLQIDPSKVSFGDEWDWVDLIWDSLGAELGVSHDLVEAKLYKFLLYEPGGFFVKHRDTEKEEGMFGTLVVQLPSIFKGGKFIVTHNGESKTFVQDDKQGFHYIAHYADCEHEIEPIESGYRLALVYSLCYKGTDTSPSVDVARYNALASAIRRLDDKYAEILCLPLEHQYTFASLSSRGAGAMKGNDRVKYQGVEAACAANQYVVIAKLERADCEYGDTGWNGEFWADDKEKIPAYVDKAYKADGSPVPDKQIERLDKLLKWFNFDSVEENGELLADQDVAKAMWGDGETSIEVTGNEGATRETTYSAYVLLMVRPAKKRRRA